MLGRFIYGWIGFVIALAAWLVASGCTSTTTTTTTKYDKDGKIVEIVKVDETDNAWILRKKGVTSHSNTFLGKISTGIDPSTGAPLPEIQVLVGDNYFNDIPMANDITGGANYSEYLHLEKSLWGAELSIMDYDRKSAGTGAPAPSVKIDLKIDKAQVAK